MVRGGVVVSPLRVVTLCCSVFWISVGEFLEQSRNGTSSFPVWFPEGCSVASTWFCGWVPFGGDVWIAIFVFKVESLWVIFKLSWSVTIYVGCCQTTSGIGGKFDISIVSGLSHAAPEWRRGMASLKFGLQLGHSHLSCFVLFFAGLGFLLLVVDSGEAVYLLRLLHFSVEWLVLQNVSQGGNTGLDLLSLWLFIFFATLLLELEFFWALPLLMLALFVLFRVWSFSHLSWRHWVS